MVGRESKRTLVTSGKAISLATRESAELKHADIESPVDISVIKLDVNDAKIVNNETGRRFETYVDGKVAFVAYRLTNTAISLDHTEVPPALEGRGLAARLTKTALEYAQSQHLKVIPRCSYVANYIQKHPEYEELVASE